MYRKLGLYYLLFSIICHLWASIKVIHISRIMNDPLLYVLTNYIIFVVSHDDKI